MSYLRNYSSCTIEKNIVEELGIIEELLYNNYSQRIVMEIYYWENAVEKLPLPTKTCGR
jgi:hypothetical protein